MVFLYCVIKLKCQNDLFFLKLLKEIHFHFLKNVKILIRCQNFLIGIRLDEIG